ncbi:MAG: molybdopterin-dependent oxidoreductase [Chloroflexi bacterium]|nr:molybdopterin-dependent oxidoreductase [Chloroflexota bacterium]
MLQYDVVGRRVPRVEGVLQATGEAVYTTDMALPGMLHCGILRSPHPHARLLRIETDRALRLPGVRAAITGRDTAAKLYGVVPDEPAIAVDKVRYVGEAVAAVAAMDEDSAEEALRLIRVEYEDLPPVFDPAQAMQPEAPLVHETLASNISASPSYQVGDVERGFAESYHVREDTFTTSAQCHCSLEPHAALANFDASGRLTIWAASQGPFYLAGDLALTLVIPLGNIRVIKPRVGGGFGSKREMMAGEFCAALLSRRTGRPVKVVYGREEEFVSTRARHPMVIRLKTGVKRDGTLVAREATLIADGGAYNSRGPIIVRAAGGHFAALYHVPNIKFTGYHVYTNNPASGAFRGFGTLQALNAVELQMDMLAEDIGLDAAKMRLRNAVHSGDTTSIGWEITSCGLSECIEKATVAIRWNDRRAQKPRNRGLGLACGDYVSGSRTFGFADSSAAYVRLQDDGTFVLLTGASDIGQGSDTTLCQIVAEELGVEMGDVRIISADTEVAPRDLGTFASRITFIAGNAAKLAAADAKRQLFRLIAERLEAHDDDLEARHARIFVKGSPQRGMSFAEVASYVMKDLGVHIQGKGDYATRITEKASKFNMSPTYSFGAQVAEVEVDTDTGKVSVRRVVAAHDCGFAINPMALEGQIEGSVACGTGHTLLEDRILEQGQMLNASLLDYRIPTSLESPQVESILVETIDPEGPFGAKGVSEGAQVPAAPAIANAIYDAVGVRISDMPITPDKVLRALELKKRRGQDPALRRL